MYIHFWGEKLQLISVTTISTENKIRFCIFKPTTKSHTNIILFRFKRKHFYIHFLYRYEKINLPGTVSSNGISHSYIKVLQNKRKGLPDDQQKVNTNIMKSVQVASLRNQITGTNEFLRGSPYIKLYLIAVKLSGIA